MLEMERILRGLQKWRPGKAYTFKCTMCDNRFTHDQPGEPLCTGPGELDLHPPEPMRLEKVRTQNRVERITPPNVAEERARGPLWVP